MVVINYLYFTLGHKALPHDAIMDWSLITGREGATKREGGGT